MTLPPLSLAPAAHVVWYSGLACPEQVGAEGMAVAGTEWSAPQKQSVPCRASVHGSHLEVAVSR
jgi:hypothetical protein